MSHPSVCFQCQVVGVSGQSGVRAPGPVGQSLCPATGVVAVLSQRLEELHALEIRRCTMGSEFKYRDNPALSSPSVQVSSHHSSSLSLSFNDYTSHLSSF